VDVDNGSGCIAGRKDVPAPAHQPGLLPPWLSEKGATVIIAGGMGQRAQELFTQHGIKVVVGAPSETPETLVKGFLEGSLKLGGNACDH